VSSLSGGVRDLQRSSKLTLSRLKQMSEISKTHVKSKLKHQHSFSLACLISMKEIR
jgi:hypothetical protein